MSKKVLAAILMVGLVPLVCAQSRFDGTWKYDLSTIQWIGHGEGHGEMLLHDGLYDCQRCDPPMKVKADGTDQKLNGNVTRDGMSVDAVNAKVADDRNLEVTYKKDGKIVRVEKRAVAADGATSTLTWTNYGKPDDTPRTGTLTFKRVAQGPAGTHLVNGQWRAVKLEGEAPIQSYRVTGNKVEMRTPKGDWYVAILDGPKARYQGDSQVDSVSVKMLNENTLQEQMTKKDKVVFVNTLTLAADGQSVEIATKSTEGPDVKIVARKQ